METTIMKQNHYKYTKVIRVWLFIGLIMLVGQVILGGITRLTGSGLSITRWDIVTGVVPPLNMKQWQEAFELYKETPQFHKINSTFTLSDFKFIYFWEYFHRLWVRSLGFIFLIPFIIFLLKKQLDWSLVKKLGLVVLLTVITASAGWIMVQSGLVDRPWVNAYKLTLHFVLAVLVISAMVVTVANAYSVKINVSKASKKIVTTILVTAFIQMIFAGLMSGMKAGLYYPTWPDMNGQFIPKELLISENWTWKNMINYDSYLFAPALIQIVHRTLAYLLLFLTIRMFYKLRDEVDSLSKTWIKIPLILVLLQVVLGILTVLNVAGKIPLFLGVSHQLVGLLYFLSILLLHYGIKKAQKKH
ncbi:COX15/CtaA family protein [Lutibacter sp.]